MIDGVVGYLVIMEDITRVLIVTIPDILSTINGKIASLYVLYSVEWFFVIFYFGNRSTDARGVMFVLHRSLVILLFKRLSVKL